jgi:hypothetical protein
MYTKSLGTEGIFNMGIEFIPSGTSAVVTRGDNNRAEECILNDIRTIIREDAANERVNAQNHKETVESAKDARYDISQLVERGIAATAAASALVSKAVSDATGHTDEEMGEAFGDVKLQMATSFGDTDRRVIKGLGEVAKGVGEGLGRVIAEVSHQGEEATENFATVFSKIDCANKDVLLGFKDVVALNYQIEGRSVLESAKNFNAVSVQADKNFAQLQLQAQMNTSEARLAAQIAAAEARAAAQACCCDLKELIRSEAGTTRALINDQNTDRLRDRATRAESRLDSFEAAQRFSWGRCGGRDGGDDGGHGGGGR